jgi:hypothetical protein
MVNHVYSRKSILGYLMTFTRWAVLWQSRLQKYVTSFTAEVKYIAFNKEKMSCYVWQSSYMILFTRKRILSRTMIVLLQSILVRILLLNLCQNTFRLYINGLKMLWRWSFFFPRIIIPMIIYWIWWSSLYQKFFFIFVEVRRVC